MKKLLAFCLLTYICGNCGNCFAQISDNEKPYYVTLSNGVAVTLVYKDSEKVLDVKVYNNEDEVEVLAVRHGIVVDSESTFLMNDELRMDLSDHDNEMLDIYVRTETETQHVGSVKTEGKPERKTK